MSLYHLGNKNLKILKIINLKLNKKFSFLVTTPLPESWNTRKPMLLLGQWCTFHPKISKIKNKFSVIKKHYCSNELKIYHNYKYVSKLYENLLSVLTKTFNEYHGTKFSDRYWRIVIGPWLRFFLDIVSLSSKEAP